MTPPDPLGYLPLPHLAFHVLLALAEGDRHGWAIIKRIEEITGGHSSPSSGSLYLSMARLEDRGLILETPAPDAVADPRRKYYRLTPLGRRVLGAEAARLAGLVDLARSKDLLAGNPSNRGRGR